MSWTISLGAGIRPIEDRGSEGGPPVTFDELLMQATDMKADPAHRDTMPDGELQRTRRSSWLTALT
jgi:hypothetical protein